MLLQLTPDAVKGFASLKHKETLLQLPLKRLKKVVLLVVDHTLATSVLPPMATLQGHTGHRPPSVAHQVRPPGFPPVQNNPNRGNSYNPKKNDYRASNFHQLKAAVNELANYMKVNETNMRAMQNQITNMKAELKNEFQATMLQQINKLENMLSNYFQMNKPPS
ncbi:hypothetical protein Tco_0984249 [Tanacetum coccineum]